MTDENVSAPAPTRSDDQILPFAAWVPIGKSNYGIHRFCLGSSYLHSTILEHVLGIKGFLTVTTAGSSYNC
ncbi:hypothetical protein Tco_0697582 [Tanacetum coccineum]